MMTITGYYDEIGDTTYFVIPEQDGLNEDHTLICVYCSFNDAKSAAQKLGYELVEM